MFLKRLAVLCRNLLRKGSVRRDLDQEIESYIELLIADNLNRGLAPDEARRAALFQMEGTTQVKEAVLDVKAGAFVEAMIRDIRYGLRVLVRKPGFFITTSLTLALGIGTATSLFSVVESQLWRPLPFHDPERLVEVSERNLKQLWQISSVSASDFADWRKRLRVFESLSAMQWATKRNFAAPGWTERTRTANISANLFDTLGISMQLGHTFLKADESPGKQDKAILTSPFAQRAFGLAQKALGQTIKVDGEPYKVVGVLPEGFRLDVLSTPDVFAPLAIDSKQPRDVRDLLVIGRLRRGISLQQATSEIQGVAEGIAKEHPDTNAHFSARVDDLRSVASWARTSLFLYFAFSIFILVISCANAACLQVMRSVARRREFAVREALGAGRSSLLRQAFAESGWIAVAGAVAGSLLAALGIHGLHLFRWQHMLPRDTEFSLNWWCILFAVIVSIAAATASGLGSCVLGSSKSIEEKLREAGRSASGGMGARRQIAFLAGVEVMLAFISLFGAGLFLTSHMALQRVRLGFDPKHVFTMQIPLSAAKYSRNSEQVRTFYRQVLQQAALSADIRKAALSSGLPLNGADGVTFLRADRPRVEHGSEPHSLMRTITPGYFELLGIPIARGRSFTEYDSESAQRVGVINENFARHLFPSEDPIGKELLISDVAQGVGRVPSVRIEIIGVVANTKEVGLNEVDFDDLYLPFAQNPNPSMYILGKTETSSQWTVLWRKLQDLDREQSVSEPRTLDSYVAETLEGSRVRLLPILIFAVLAVLLTAIALYGTLSFDMAQRTREIGVRIALGAQPIGVLGLALGHVLRLAAAGSVCGFVIVLVVGTTLGNALYMVPYQHDGMLYQVGMHDPLSFACAASILTCCAVLAGILPGFRAARVDPCNVLREE